MTITQADREAASKFIDPSDGDFDELAGLFAAHREAERRAIVEWLREKAEPLPINGDKRHIIQHLADAIERDEDRT